MKLWQLILSKLGKKSKDLLDAKHYFAKDEATLILPDLIIKLDRYTNLEVPHEVTMVVPRVEIRKKGHSKGGTSISTETLLNSVTVVSAPRHPLAGEAGKPPTPAPSAPSAPSTQPAPSGPPAESAPTPVSPAKMGKKPAKHPVKVRINNKML